jgi:hypothetical protein
VNVEGRARAGWIQFWPTALTHVLAIVAAWNAAPSVWAAAAVTMLMLASAARRAYAFSRRHWYVLAIRDGALVVDGEPVELARAWIVSGWVVLRGLRAGRRFRLSVRAADLGTADFSRLSRLCVATLPAVSRPRAATRRVPW